LWSRLSGSRSPPSVQRRHAKQASTQEKKGGRLGHSSAETDVVDSPEVARTDEGATLGDRDAADELPGIGETEELHAATVGILADREADEAPVVEAEGKRAVDA